MHHVQFVNEILNILNSSGNFQLLCVSSFKSHVNCSFFFPFFFHFGAMFSVTGGNPDAKRLYDDLLSNYNKLVRPVVNVSDALMVKIKLKLSQLIDVNLKNQIMTTNLWVEQSW